MKRTKFLLKLIIVFISFNVFAQEKYPIMTFEETSYDFGTIHEKDIVKHVFKFKNTGNAPLIITNMRASCGCTAANYSRKPIPPGGEGQFTVTFNSTHKTHKQFKRVTITCNTKKTKEYVNITADVIPDPELEKIRKQRYEQMIKRREEAMKKRKEMEKKRKENAALNKQNKKELSKNQNIAEKKVNNTKVEEKKIKKINKLKNKINKINKKILKLQRKINKFNKEIKKLQH